MTPTQETLAQHQVKTGDFDRLAAKINQGRCVLVLGPQAITSANGKPLSQQLAKELAMAHGLNTRPAQFTLAQVNQRILDKGAKRWEIAESIQKYYSKLSSDTSTVCELLATLPFKICLTTTHDPFLYNAIAQTEGKQPQHIYYRITPLNEKTLTEPSVRHPVVYQLFGSPDDEESLILSDNDILSFLKRLACGEPALPSQIEGPLHSEDNVFLFVGFGFQQWYVRTLLYSLLGDTRIDKCKDLRPSLVLEQTDFFNHVDSQEAIYYFHSQQSFAFRSTSSEQMIEQLSQLCDSCQVAPVQAAAQVVHVDAPTVFLSYLSVDLDRVNRLREQLENAGINTWQDKQNLRGGDQWEQAIEQVIKRQVDYFVLVQSEELKCSRKSVVYQELKLAEECAKRMPSNSKFLIPIELDPGSRLDDPYVKAAHSISLANDTDCGELIAAIREDWSAIRGQTL